MSGDPRNGQRGGSRLKLIFELTELCNFSCTHCFRSELGSSSKFLDRRLLERVLDEIAVYGAVDLVAFTGGEPTLHPEFAAIVAAVAERGRALSFVTNGWRFAAVLDAIRPHLDALRNISFSLDGGCAATHDALRKREGSFREVLAAITRCRHLGVEVQVNSVVTRANADELEEIVALAARLGCRAVGFAHCLPTPEALAAGLVMTVPERLRAEADVATLDELYRMPVRMAGDHHCTNAFEQCPQLRLEELNVDSRGRLTACCMLSGFRGGAAASDVVADLNEMSLVAAHQRLVDRSAELNRSRLERLAGAELRPSERFLCSHCLIHYRKAPDLVQILEAETPRAPAPKEHPSDESA